MVSNTFWTICFALLAVVLCTQKAHAQVSDVHGASIEARIETIRCVGGVVSVVATVCNADLFGDTINVGDDGPELDAWLTIRKQNGDILSIVPLKVGNILGNGVCSDFDDPETCFLGGPGAICQGLPGNGEVGCIELIPRDPFILTEEHAALGKLRLQVSALSHDVCDRGAEGDCTQDCEDNDYNCNCSIIDLLQTGVTTVTVINPDINITKDCDPGKICHGTSTSVTCTYSVTNKTDTSQLSSENTARLCNVSVFDDVCGAATFLGGDTDGDECLDVDEEWLYECKSIVSEKTTNIVTVTANSIATGCDEATDTATYTIESNQPKISVPPNTKICEGDQVELCAFATHGSEPYTIVWADSLGNEITCNGLSEGEECCINVSSAGSYTATVTDATGCTDSEDVFVDVNRVTINPKSGKVCEAGESGIICANAEGGSPPYTYVWIDPNGNPVPNSSASDCISGTKLGTYSITVFDSTQCSATGTADLEIHKPLIELPQDFKACTGDSVQLCATVGGGSEPYKVEFFNSSNQPLQTWNNVFENAPPCCLTVGPLSAGLHEYRAVVTDVNQCSNDASITIEVDAPTVEPKDAKVCEPGQETQLCVNVRDGSPPYRYEWTDPNGNTIEGNSECIIASKPGTYQVTVTDSNECSDHAKVRLRVLKPSIELPPQVKICDGSEQEIRFTVGGGTGPYTVVCRDPSGDFAVACSELEEGEECSFVVSEDGQYCCTISDRNGCSNEACVKVEVNALKVHGKDAKVCEPNEPVQLCVNVSGGDEPYTYAWTDPNGNKVFKSNSPCILATKPGTYSVVVFDVNQCRGDGEVILETKDLRVNPKDDKVCNQIDTGFLCANATGSNQPLTYQWFNPSNDAILNSNSDCIQVSQQGDYRVVVTDSSGCEVEGFATLFKTDLSINPKDDKLCTQTGEGTLCANANGRNQPLTYEWTDPNGDPVPNSNTDCITASKPGDYHVKVIDSSGCSVEGKGTLFVSDLKVNPKDCKACPSNTAGDPGGRETCVLCANASGGNPPYTYEWLGPGGFPVPNSEESDCVTVTEPGVYGVRVTDAVGCTAEGVAEFFISKPEIHLPQNFKICTDDNAQICASVNGGSPPYTVEFFDGQGASVQVWNDVTPNSPPCCYKTNPLPNGSHRFCARVTDSNQCSNFTCVTIEVDSPELKPRDAKICSPDEGALLCVLTNGGSSPFTYEWTDPNGNVLEGESDCIFASKPGTYKVTVTDGNFCTAETKVRLEVLKPTIDLPTTVKICENTQGQVCGTVGGGSGPYTITCRDPQGNSVPVPGQFNDGDQFCFPVSQDGLYCCTVVDQNKCSNEECVKVQSIRLVVKPKDAKQCEPEQQVQLCVNVNEGSGDYTYQWFDPNSGEPIDGSDSECILADKPGIYRVVVSDTDGCVGETSVTLFEGTLRIQPKDYVICTESETGILCANATGENQPLTYIWIDPNGNAVPDSSHTDCISATKPGDYRIIVTDSAGCSVEGRATLHVGDLRINPKDDKICSPEETGRLCANASGGNGVLTYEWTDPNGDPIENANTDCIEVSKPGDYRFKVTDDTGCFREGKAKLDVGDLRINPKDTKVCKEGETGVLCANASGGNGELTYEWTDPNGESIENANSDCIEVTKHGDYTVKVTDGAGCMAQGTATLFRTDLKMYAKDDKVCKPGETGKLCANARGSNEPFRYEWFDPDNNPIPDSDSRCISVSVPGVYHVTVFDTAGCQTSDKATLHVSDLKVHPKDDKSCQPGSPGTLCANASGNNEPLTYQWFNPQGNPIQNSNSDCIEVFEPGDYHFTVTDAAGCEISDKAKFHTGDLKIEPKDDKVCSPEDSGVLCANASGGNGELTYEWTKPNGDPVPNSSKSDCIEVSKPGDYRVRVSDETGCVVEGKAKLDAGDLRINPKDDKLCSQDQSGVLCANATGSNQPLTYEWRDPDGDVIPNSNFDCIDVSKPGDYRIKVTDSEGCMVEGKAKLDDGDFKVNVMGEAVCDSGACCLPDGSCEVLLFDECRNRDGVFQGVGSSCSVTKLGEPGRWLLCNHPDGNAAPPFYGLRLDELFDVTGDHDIFTFNFEWPGAEVFLDYDGGSTIHIHGNAFGGRDTGNGYDGAWFSEVIIDFTYTTVTDVPGDDDQHVTTPDFTNTGTIEWVNTGEVISLRDYSGEENFTFRFGNEDDDLGHREFPGISGWGWLLHGKHSQHIGASDWLFTAKPLCEGDGGGGQPSDGELCAMVSGGNAPYTVQWYDDQGQTVEGGFCENVPEGGQCCIPVNDNREYCAVATDTALCEAEQCGRIGVIPKRLVTVNDKNVCDGDLPTKLCATVGGGTPPYTVDWFNSSGGFEGSCSNLDENDQCCIDVPKAGEYCAVATDKAGCIDEDCGTVSVDSPFCNFKPLAQDPECDSTGNVLSANIFGGTPPYSIDWSVSGDGWSITDGQGTDTIVYSTGSGQSSGTFNLTVFDLNDCETKCEITIQCDSEGDDCCIHGKPRILTMRYTGDDCSATSHTQDDGKVTCSGDLDGESQVRILATNKADPDDDSAKVWFDGIVNLNELFNLDALNAGEDRLSSNTWLHVFSTSGDVLQTVKFHTSCSQPLLTGDQYGSALLVDCVGVDEPVPGDCCVDGRPSGLIMRYTGDDCSATSHSQDPSKVSCNGDPNDASPVRILATNKDDPDDDGAKVWFDGNVNLNDTFVIDSANANENDLDSNTWVYVFNTSGQLLQSIKFHTSCSQPLFVGNQFGSIELVECDVHVKSALSTDEGCSPAYWNPSHHHGRWIEPFAPGDLFSDHFADAFPNMTLAAVLDLHDSSGSSNVMNSLGSHAVASALNAASPDVDYLYSTQDVISMFDSVYPSSNQSYLYLRDVFARENEASCPLNGNADVNDDGYVNVDDMLELIGNWGSSGRSDIDSNGTVNVDDLLILIGWWGS